MDNEGVVPLNNQVFDPKMTNHEIEIYYFAPSPPSRSVLMLIKALGIKHKIKITNILAGDHMTPEFLKLNPLHTIPTIIDNGFVLYESNVIMKYLVDQYAKDDSFYPTDAKRGAIVNQRLYFCATYLFPRLRAYAGAVLQGNQPDPAMAVQVDEALAHLDGFLKNQTWVAGQYLTIADFAIITVIATVEGLPTFDLTKFQNIWAWYQRTKTAMADYGYDEVNQAGADAFCALFKSKLKSK